MDHLGNSNQYNQVRRRDSYIEGNTVRQLQTAPQRKKEVIQDPKRNKAVSNRTYQNRKKALQTSKGYVFFLALVSITTLFMCIHYLQLRSTVTNQLKKVANLESTLSNLKAENDALYDKAMSSVDIEQIKKVAIEKLGMQYATKEQIIWYNTSGTSYFRQYQDVPDTK